MLNLENKVIAITGLVAALVKPPPNYLLKLAQVVLGARRTKRKDC